jgi:hypothetical protein
MFIKTVIMIAIIKVCGIAAIIQYGLKHAEKSKT